MRSWNAGRGPPSRVASCATTAARLPPALSPPTAMRAGSAPSAAASRDRPAERGERVVDRGGKAMLGRQAVVDGEHAARRPRRRASGRRRRGCRGRRRPSRRRGSRRRAPRADRRPRARRGARASGPAGPGSVRSSIRATGASGPAKAAALRRMLRARDRRRHRAEIAVAGERGAGAVPAGRPARARGRRRAPGGPRAGAGPAPAGGRPSWRRPTRGGREAWRARPRRSHAAGPRPGASRHTFLEWVRLALPPAPARQGPS